MWSEIARLRTTSPRKASRSYESVRCSTQEECVNACLARSPGSSSTSVLSESSASGRLLGDARRHEVDYRPHRLHLRGLVIGDSNVIGDLELDQKLDQVQGVDVQVVLEARLLADLVGVDLQLRGQVVPDPLEHLLSGHDPLPTLTAAADADASEPLSLRAASVRSTTPSSTARCASRTAVATPTGVAFPWVTNAPPRRPSRIPAPTESWLSSSRRRRALLRIRSPPSDEIAPERIVSRTAAITVMAVPSTALSATLPVNPSVTPTSSFPPAMSSPSTLPAKSSGPSLSTRLASTTSSVPFLGSSPTERSPTHARSTPCTASM